MTFTFNTVKTSYGKSYTSYIRHQGYHIILKSTFPGLCSGFLVQIINYVMKKEADSVPLEACIKFNNDGVSKKI